MITIISNTSTDCSKHRTTFMRKDGQNTQMLSTKGMLHLSHYFFFSISSLLIRSIYIFLYLLFFYLYFLCLFLPCISVLFLFLSSFYIFLIFSLSLPLPNLYFTFLFLPPSEYFLLKISFLPIVFYKLLTFSSSNTLHIDQLQLSYSLSRNWHISLANTLHLKLVNLFHVTFVISIYLKSNKHSYLYL